MLILHVLMFLLKYLTGTVPQRSVRHRAESLLHRKYAAEPRAKPKPSASGFGLEKEPQGSGRGMPSTGCPWFKRTLRRRRPQSTCLTACSTIYYTVRKCPVQLLFPKNQPKLGVKSPAAVDRRRELGYNYPVSGAEWPLDGICLGSSAG